MLKITIPEREWFNNETGEFVTIPSQTLCFEHSLYAMSKWESKWKKAFLANDDKHQKTQEELLDYIRCMCLDEEVDPLVIQSLSRENFEKITEYMNDSMTATWFREDPNHRPSKEVVTTELVYYWLSAAQIPFETQYWHFNRLMTLIRVASIKSQPPKKMSKQDVLRQNQAANRARRKPHKPHT